MATGRGTSALEESKCHFCLQKGQEGGPRELLSVSTHQTHLDPWESDETASPGNHFQTHEGHRDDQE